MGRIRDSIRASCSSPLNSSTGLSFKRRPTSQARDEDWQADLLKNTSTLPDRAARKEIERQRLRKLLNQGKKKRRRLNDHKLLTSPGNGATSIAHVDDLHCRSREPQSKSSGLSPAIALYAHVPRKPRSVGYRRKGKSWKSIGLIAQIQLPIPSAPTVEKSSPLSFQNEIEIEFEIAEVLSGLKKQVSSPDELLIEDLEKIPVENDDNQSFSLQNDDNHDMANLTTEGISAPTEEMESKQPEKFVIDLNEPPFMESSLEGYGMEKLTPDPKVVYNKEVKSVPEEATVRRFDLPWKMEIKSELQDRDLGSPDDSKNSLKQPSHKQQKVYSYTTIASDSLGQKRIVSTSPPQGISECGIMNCIKSGAREFKFYSHNTKQENSSTPVSTHKITDEHASHQIHKPLQPGSIKVGPLIFPLSQNQTSMANHQSGLSRSASSTGNVRFSYPIGTSFLSVLPRNVCTNPSSDGKRTHSRGGRNAQPVPKFDGQLHPSQMCLPNQVQQQQQLPFTTQAFSSVADIQTFRDQRNVTPQTLFPHSTNVASTPSSFSYPSSTQNHVLVPSFLENTNLGSQTFPADRGLQHRHSEIIQKINQADFTLASGNSSWIKQSGFILKSCSTSPTSTGAKVTTPNCKPSFDKQDALAARIHLSNSIPLGASQNKPTSVQLKNQQQLQAMAALPTVNNQHQIPIAAKVSNNLSIFSGNLYDRSSTLHNPHQKKLTLPNSHPLT